MNEGTTFKYFLSDHLGSTSLVLSNTGSILEQQRYLPFGQPRAMSPAITSTDFTYTGQRALPDSLIADIADPQDLNRFSYVLNNPILYNDPSGHCIWDLCIVEGIGLVELSLVAAAAVGTYVWMGQKGHNTKVGGNFYPDVSKLNIRIRPPSNKPKGFLCFNSWKEFGACAFLAGTGLTILKNRLQCGSNICNSAPVPPQATNTVTPTITNTPSPTDQSCPPYISGYCPDTSIPPTTSTPTIPPTNTSTPPSPASSPTPPIILPKPPQQLPIPY